MIEHMNENDKVTQLPRRTLSASNYLTPITNKANVAMRLGESFGKKAHDRVWLSEWDQWEDRAQEYVNLVYGNHYGTRWITDGSHAGVHGAGSTNVPFETSNSLDGNRVHTSHVIVPPGARLDQVSSEHPSPTPLAAHLRFDGGEK